MINIKPNPKFNDAQVIAHVKETFSTNNEGLFSVDFSCHKLKNSTIKQLATILKNRQITEINLSSMNLTDEGLASFEEALKTNQYLNKLDLSHNRITNNSALIISNQISSHPQLITNLKFNHIGASGAETIARTIVKSSNSEINFSNNLIGNQGAQKIADILADRSGNVTSLVLFENGITDEGDRYLAKIVPPHIKIFHRIKSFSFSDFIQQKPLFLLVLLIFPPLLLILPFMKFKQEIEGCDYPRRKLTY